MEVGDIIKKIRKQKGLTQAELAELAGVTKLQVSQFETGKITGGKSVDKIYECLKLPPQLIKYLTIDEDQICETKRDVFKEINPQIVKLIEKFVKI